MRFFKIFKKEKKIRQTCFCYCSECNNELCGSNSFVSDEEVVTYKCDKCGEISIWNFDIAPVPILLSHKE